MKDTSIKRLYYSISEVSRLADEEQYVLRYWETEFEQLRPQKNRAGNRIYTDKDVSVIKAVKRLLREKRYTIEGAKEVMKQYYRPELGEVVEPETDGLPLEAAARPTDEGETSPTWETERNGDLPKPPSPPPAAATPAQTPQLSLEDLREARELLRQIVALFS